jgi:anti-sigma factor RsiW
MNERLRDHPDRLELEGYIDDTIRRDRAQSIAEHLGQCEECARYVQRIRSLRETLGGLAVEARATPPIEQMASALARRSGRDRFRAQWSGRSRALLAASAVLIFAAGVAAGMATTRAPSGGAESAPAGLRPVLDVQHAGSSYIAALVKLNASSGGDEQAAAYGREVALATLYGAAAEAVDYLPSDGVASELLAAARAARERVAHSPTTTRDR